MRGITHAAIGANVVWIPSMLGLTVAPWLVVVGAFVALLPDLDASESRIKNLTIGGKIGGAQIGIRPLAPIAMVLSSLFGHRAALHSLLMVAVISLGTRFIPIMTSSLWLVIILGYVSHLVLDMLTKSGVEIFWPIKTHVGLLPRFLRVKTGGLLDTVLLLVSSAGVIFFLHTVIRSMSVALAIP
jgi:membrane-bound metal-dependent hydrolase YbcI (DUF457 family)